MHSQQLKHLVPDLTNFKHTSPCHNKVTEIVAFSENYQQPVEQIELLRTVAADSQVINCNRFSYQQGIHILRSMQAPKVLDLIGHNCLAKSIPNQYSLLDRCIYNSVQDKPVFPSTHGGSVLDKNHTLVKAYASNVQPPKTE